LIFIIALPTQEDTSKKKWDEKTAVGYENLKLEVEG